MKGLIKAFDQAVTDLIAEAKIKSKTYGEAKRYLIHQSQNQAYKGATDLEKLISKTAIELLEMESNGVTISK